MCSNIGSSFWQPCPRRSLAQAGRCRVDPKAAPKLCRPGPLTPILFLTTWASRWRQSWRTLETSSCSSMCSTRTKPCSLKIFAPVHSQSSSRQEVAKLRTSSVVVGSRRGGSFANGAKEENEGEGEGEEEDDEGEGGQEQTTDAETEGEAAARKPEEGPALVEEKASWDSPLTGVGFVNFAPDGFAVATTAAHERVRAGVATP
mmetsp:Transcript_64194/g.139474  ORF Transcript_64194/g.139474 Transcript_64194/m.139474 type:complete len:203 (-) Transcript_64194:403-1011(-)